MLADLWMCGLYIFFGFFLEGLIWTVFISESILCFVFVLWLFQYFSIYTNIYKHIFQNNNPKKHLYGIHKKPPTASPHPNHHNLRNPSKHKSPSLTKLQLTLRSHLDGIIIILVIRFVVFWFVFICGFMFWAYCRIYVD